MEKPKILIVDDDKSVLTSLLILFRHHNFNPTIENDPKNIKKILLENTFDAVLLDMNFRRGFNEGKEGIFWLELIREVNKNIKILLMTAYGDVDLAVSAIKKGASDFILKPWDNEKLIAKVKTVITKKEVEKSILNKTILLGNSPSIKSISNLINKSITLYVPIQVIGENGSGKKIIAKIIFEKKGITNFKTFDFSIDNDFLTFNNINSFKGILLHNLDFCTEKEQELISSLIDKNETQIITTKSSSNDTINRSLNLKLNLIEIKTTPLREEKEYISDFANSLLLTLADKYQKKNLSFTTAAENKLSSHIWTGNLKELKHCIERAVILSDSETINASEIKIDKSTERIKKNYNSTLNLSELEKDAILNAIEDSNGNITNAAKILGITRTALYRRMEKHDI